MLKQGSLTDKQFHEVANIFPLMEGEPFKELCNDIAANGLIEPIWTWQNKIIDGRNRYRACMEIGIEPEYREFKGGDEGLLTFVLALNLKRRHLTSSQRAAVAVDVEAFLAKQTQVGRPQKTFEKIQKLPNHAAKQAAQMLGTNEHYVVDAKKLKEESPRVFEQVLAGNMTLIEAKKNIQAEKRTEERKAIAEKAKSILPSDRWSVVWNTVENWKTDKLFDFIITDPPYPKEYLHLYEVLAIRSKEWLKPGGLLIAMCGQSYLDQIYTMMSKHISYYWTAAYLTPGQPTPLRQVNVNTTWKPLLIFSNGKYTGKIFGDVFVSDGNDKSFHKWGQSESGMYSIISKICLEGQSILDPFCGAGTTGIASLRHGCLFTGLEKEKENVEIASGRLADYDNSKN